MIISDLCVGSNGSDIKKAKPRKGKTRTNQAETTRAQVTHGKYAMSYLLGGLEDVPILGLALERHTKLQKLDVNVSELLEESIVVLSITLNVLLEGLVVDQSHVGGQHHEGGGALVGELSRATPLALVPLLLDQQTEELVAEDSRAEVPRTIETRAVGVGATQSVGTDQGNHLTIIESHAGEDITNVTVILGRIGQTTIGGAGNHLLVLTTGSPGDLGATQLLDGRRSSQSPEVRVSDPRELGLDGLQEVACVLETGIGAVARLGSESHCGTVATTSVGLLVVGTTSVPGETDENLRITKCTLSATPVQNDRSLRETDRKLTGP